MFTSTQSIALCALLACCGCATAGSIESRRYNRCERTDRSPPGSTEERARRELQQGLLRSDTSTVFLRALSREEVEELAGAVIDESYGETYVLIRVTTTEGETGRFTHIYMPGERTWDQVGYQPFARLLISAPEAVPPTRLSLTPPKRKGPGLVEVVAGTVWSLATLGFDIPRGRRPIDPEKWRAFSMRYNARQQARYQVSQAWAAAHPGRAGIERLTRAAERTCDDGICARLVLMKSSGDGAPDELRMFRTYQTTRGAAWWDLRTKHRCEVKLTVTLPIADASDLRDGLDAAFADGPISVQSLEQHVYEPRPR